MYLAHSKLLKTIKTKINNLTFYFYVFNCCILLFSCDSSKSDWEAAKLSETIESYENYLKLHPNCKYATEASLQIQKLIFQQANSTNTIASYQYYLIRFPNGNFANEAKIKINNLKLYPFKNIGYDNLMFVNDYVTMWCDDDSIKVNKYEAKENTFISWDDLIIYFNWDQTARIFHPKGSENKFAGIRINGNGERVTFGNMCTGNILLSGPAILKGEGILLQKGAFIIHPQKYIIQDDVSALDYRAYLLQNKDRHQEAEELFRRALRLTEMKHGSNHSSVAVALNNLAVNLSAQKNYYEAENLLKRAIEIEEIKYGQSSPKLVKTIENLATVLENKGSISESEDYYKRANKIKNK